MKTLRRLLWRDLVARRAQFLAVSVTILLGVALFGASYDAFQNLNASYRGLYDRLAFADVVATGGSTAQVSSSVASVPGVAAVATRTVADVPLEVGSHRLLGRVVGLPPDAQPAVDRVLVLSGSYLDPGQPDGVLVEQHMASQFGLHAGDVVQVLTPGGFEQVPVIGIVASPEYLWPARSRQEIIVSPEDFGVVFASESLVQRLVPADSQHETLVRLAADAPASTLDAVRGVAIGAGASDTQTQAQQPSNAALQEDVSGFGELSLMFPVLFLGAAALATYILLGRMVAAQRRQIGMLLAVGFSRRRILAQYVALGLLVGLAGSVPGAVIGALSAEAISRVYTGMISVPITIVEVRPLTLLVGLVIGPLAGALAATAPPRRAANLSPAVAMGAPVSTGIGGRSLAERLVPPLRRLPLRWLVALRGLGRNRLRSLSTVLGVALAASLVLVSWAMIDTVQVLLDRQFQQVQQQDAQLYLDAPVSARAATAVANVQGVAAAEPALELQATVTGPSGRYSTAVVGLRPDTTMHVFVAPGGGQLALPDRGILLGTALRGQLGVSQGDTVRVSVSVGGQMQPAADLRVAGFVDEPLGTFAYASLGQVATLAGENAGNPAVGSVLVRFDPGADREAMRTRLSEQPGVAAYADSRSLYDIAQQFMGLFYAFIGVMLLFGAVMAFALIFNTLSANVAERATELAALRTLGMSGGTIARLVTAENLVLTILGLVPGLVGGYLLAVVFMASFSSDMFDFNVHAQPVTFIVTGLAIIAVAVISQVPAIRSIGRIDLARIIRERSL